MRILNKKYWPYQFHMGKGTPRESTLNYIEKMERFCYDSFQSKNWRNADLYFCFKREEDASFFALRFGHGD